MKNTKIKKILKIFLKFLWSVFVVICAVTICIFCYFLFDKKAGCLDLGKIYDPEQNICREDCLTWDAKLGCVPVTPENVRKKEKGLPFSQ